MASPAGWEYPVVLVVCAALTLVLTPLALAAARRWGVLDQPGPTKSHSEAVPYLGGLAIVVSFSAVLLLASLVRRGGSDTSALLTAVGLGTGLAVIGLLDDMRTLPVWLRLAAEVGAGVVLYATGTRAHLAGAGDGLDAVITVVWVVAITNAFNLLDNMDGLSSGVAAIASFWFFIVGVVNGQYLVAVLALALVGCAAGFLPHNFAPARIYMGDAGALFLGFILAVLALRLRTYTSLRLSFLVPVLILAVPIFDTALVVVTRTLHRRNPLRGGKDHTSHRLVFVGLPVPAAVALIYALTVATGWLGVIISRVSRGTSFLIGGWVVAFGLFLGVLLGTVPVYETSRRRRYMLRIVDPHETDPPQPAQPPAADPEQRRSTS